MQKHLFFNSSKDFHFNEGESYQKLLDQKRSVYCEAILIKHPNALKPDWL
jgi:hypothetical protein